MIHGIFKINFMGQIFYSLILYCSINLKRFLVAWSPVLVNLIFVVFGAQLNCGFLLKLIFYFLLTGCGIRLIGRNFLDLLMIL